MTIKTELAEFFVQFFPPVLTFYKKNEKKESFFHAPEAFFTCLKKIYIRVSKIVVHKKS